MSQQAFLTGTVYQPALHLVFKSNARTPQGRSVLDWVRQLPNRRWDKQSGCWIVTGIGAYPEDALHRAGFDIDHTTLVTDPALEQITSLDDLVDPVLKRSKQRPHLVLVRPRLAGFTLTRDRLGAGAVWDKTTGRFTMPIGDVLDEDGHPRHGLIMSESVIDEARKRRTPEPVTPGLGHVAQAVSIDDMPAEARHAADTVGPVPDWFGLGLYDYQRVGAVAAAGGHRLIADPMGVGKTRTALAAMAIVDVRRLLIICPPVALTQWQRETSASMVAAPVFPGGARASERDTDQVVVITAKKKPPMLPDVGAVVVSDSLLASRPELVAELDQWAADGLIVDEVHRHKTWSSARSGVVRHLADGVDGLRLALSGTPMFANPVELISPLHITGQLDPVFGGFDRFATTFARQNRFNAWVARPSMLAQLRAVFIDRVWVRRRKEDVTDLPAKTRRDVITDVDLSGFRRSHRDVKDKISDWADSFRDQYGRLPARQEIAQFASDSFALVSTMRQAAGLAKVAAAAEYITTWLGEMDTHTDEDGSVVYDRPLVVWTHHLRVTEAMSEAVVEAVGEQAQVIDGGTDHEARTRIVDEFQAGRVPVLVASITAAGTGITLTRSCDALFVETDWTPALVQQAEDRIHRVGSSRPVTIMTMVAPGTLDERVQHVLARKGGLLDGFMGTGQDVSVVDFDDDESVAPAQIVTEIATEVVDRKRKRQRKAA